MDKLPFEEVKRKIVVKKNAETDEQYGTKPEKRAVEELTNFGIVNINKPAGPTSHEVSSYVKKILGIKKSGHSGTLDPNVTGVLPVALGRGTRIVQTLLRAGKEYVCLMHLHKEVSEKEIKKIFKEFTGEIEQLPPIKSAVKRQLRKRNIYYLEFLEMDGKDVLFRVGCEAGTYVRKICHDIGRKLGTGAHMQELVRTKAGPFDDRIWTTLHDLKDAYDFYKEGRKDELKRIIMPIEKAVEYLPKVWILDSAVDSICHGASLSIPGISRLNEFKENEIIAVMSLKEELICLGKAIMSSNDIIERKEGVAIRTSKVFMERGTYMKYKK